MTALLILITISLVLKAPEQRCLYIERAEGIEYFDMNDLSLLLNKYQIKYPEIVKRQICLETGHLTSFVCKHYHNLCGMKYANRRKTTAIGVEKSYAVYSNYEKSVQDYKSGEVKALNFLIGQVMQATNKRADFQIVKSLLEKELK